MRSSDTVASWPGAWGQNAAAVTAAAWPSSSNAQLGAPSSHTRTVAPPQKARRRPAAAGWVGYGVWGGGGSPGAGAAAGRGGALRAGCVGCDVLHRRCAEAEDLGRLRGEAVLQAEADRPEQRDVSGGCQEPEAADGGCFNIDSEKMKFNNKNHKIMLID